MNRGPWIVAIVSLSLLACSAWARAGNWYQESFWLLHEDHHTSDRFEVGRDADLEQTRRLVGLVRPDVIQMHAKGNPGWTTYPSKIGHTPPKLAKDVLGIWRDVARKDGYHFSVYYNIGRDGVIMDRRPEWNRVGADGRPIERALCYHSGVAEGYLWPMIREIIDGYHPDGFWFDGSCFTVRPCYCEKCAARFRRLHDLPPPRNPRQPGWAWYQQMQRQIYREFVHQTAAMIHRIDPHCLVAFNWAYSCRMPEKPDEGIAYLSGDIGNHVEGLSAEAHWYDGTGLPFDLMTQVNVQPGAPWIDGSESALRAGPKPKPQIEQEMAIIVANGGRYFAWDTPTPQSGLEPGRFAFMARVITPFLRARQPWCLGSKRLADVSLLHSAAAHYSLTEARPASFTRGDNRIDGAAEKLPRLHLNYEMLPDWRLQAQEVGSRLIVVEHPKRLTRKTADALIRFVRQGGSLLMTGMGIGCDERLGELFGIAESVGAKGEEDLRITWDGKEHSFRHWLFRLRPASAESLIEVTAADGATYPFLTRNRFGPGEAFYVPVPLFSLHGKNIVPPEVLQAVVDLVLPPQQRRLATDAPETVEVVLREKDDRQIVHLVNMAPGRRQEVVANNRRYRRIEELPPVPACRIWVRLGAKPASVRLQPQDRPAPRWSFTDGRLQVEVPSFAVHQMVVIEPAG